MNKIHSFLFALLLWVQPGFAQTELISNNGFDSGVLPWKLETLAANICTGSSAPSAPNFGCMNASRFQVGDAAIYQQVSFPTCVQTATISFQYQLIPYQSTQAVDKMEVRVQDLNNSNNVVYVTTFYNNLHGFSTFRLSTTNVFPESIKQISTMSKPTLVFSGSNTSGETAFAIDDVHFTVTRGAPLIDFSASDTIISRGASVDFYNLTAGAPTGWQWKFYDGSPLGYQTSGVYNPEGISYYKSGMYSVTLTGTNTLGTATRTKLNYIKVSPGVGIQKNPDAPVFTVEAFPNPVTDMLTLAFRDELERQDMTVNVINQVGEQIVCERLPAGTTERVYDLREYASGIYSIVVSSHDITLTQKVVKR